MSDDRYRQAVSTLATAEARRAAEVAEAISWYEGQVAQRAETHEQAVTAVDNASIRVAAGHTMLGRVEEEADRLWQDLRAFLGRLGGGRLGPVPAADPEVGPGQPWRHVQNARARLDRAHRPLPLRRVLYLLLPFLGAVCGAGFTLLVRLVWRLAGGLPMGVGVGLAVLGAPLLAVLTARWVTRREGARLDGGSLGGAVLGALIAVSFIMLFVR